MERTVRATRVRSLVRPPRALPWLAVTASLQCSDLGGIVDELSRSFVVTPGTVAPGDSLRAVLTLHNPTGRSVSLTGLYACPAFLFAKRDAVEIELEGSKFDCPPAATNFRIASRDALVVNYHLKAAVRTPGTSGPYTAAAAGTYRLRADLNMSLPDMEATFTVTAGLPATRE